VYSLELAAVASFLLAYVLTPAVRDWFLKVGWLDRPDGDRKVHSVPIPRVGGIAIVAAYVGTFAIVAAVDLNGWKTTQIRLDLVLSVLPGVAIVFLIGLLDDKRGVRPWLKLGAQLAAALIVFIGGLHVKVLHLACFDKWWLSLPVTLLWLVLCTNAFNLIDGMDGLSSGLGLFATLTLICAAAIQKNFPLLLATIPLAGALLGFLRYNSSPASIFLGDCGSYAMGFLLGCFGIVWSQKSATLLGLTAPIVCFAVPLLDLLLAVVRRLLNSNPIFGADRHHMHHRLLDRGLTPRRAVLVLYGSAGLAAVFALLSTVLRDMYAGLIFIPFVCAAWLGVKNLGYKELQAVDPVRFVGKARQSIQAEKILQAARMKLGAAETSHARWEAIKTMARDLGFCYVGTTMEGVSFFESFDSLEEVPAWIITIPLGGGRRLELAHRWERQELAAACMHSLAELLRTQLDPNRVSVTEAVAKQMHEQQELQARGHEGRERQDRELESLEKAVS
jgi:UDP-GlcNAc:undecaprenyl-phosphate/decaprenyl-phosphate GlcNAc-1-phosphate transferase